MTGSPALFSCLRKCSLEVAFLTILLTCVDQQREDSIWTPNNLKQPTHLMVPEELAGGGKFSLVSGPMTISLILILLTCIWFSVAQVSSFSKKWIMFEACELGGSS